MSQWCHIMETVVQTRRSLLVSETLCVCIAAGVSIVARLQYKFNQIRTNRRMSTVLE